MLYIATLFILTIVFFVVVPIKIAMMIADHLKKHKDTKEPTETPDPERTVSDEKKEDKEDSASFSIMLLIGTVFIILSGIAFGIAGWVNTTPAGRVGILFTAAASAFLISVLFRKVFRLTGTSTAFYSLGSVLCSITFITAGVYDLFGEWLSFDGKGGPTLAAIAVLIAGTLSVLGYRLYRHNAFIYTALSSLYVSLHFVLCQLTDTFEHYTLAAIAAQALITAIIHVFKPQRKSPLSADITLVSNIASMVFGGTALYYMLINVFDPRPSTILINMIIVAELAFYGIWLHKPRMINMQSVLEVLALIQVFSYIDGDERYKRVYFAICIIVLHLIHRFVPVFRTRFTEDATIGAAALASLTQVFDLQFTLYPFAIPAIIVTGIIVSYVFSKKTSVQLLAGLIFPVLPLSITASLAYTERFSDPTVNYMMTFGILAILLIAAAAIFFLLPKFLPVFSAKHPRTSDSVIYTSLAVSGMVMLRVHDWSIYLLIFAAALPVHYLLSSKQKNNICTAFPLVSTALLVYSWLKSIGIEEHFEGSVVMLIVFLCYAVASKLFFRTSMTKRTGDRLYIDTPLIASTVPMLLSWLFSDYTAFFLFLVHAVFITLFVNSGTEKKTAATVFTISAILMTIAFFNRPFWVSDSEMVTVKLNLAVIALLGAAFRYIWREFPDTSHKLSDFVWTLAFIGLLADAFYFQTAGNTIFVLGVIGAVLIFSFLGRNKKWFKLSAASIAAITIYSTRKYLMALDWWVYLFIAGIVLISIAALNEYYKNKGDSLKGKFTRSFDSWSR